MKNGPILTYSNFTGTLLDETDFIPAFRTYIREIGRINPNHSSWVTNNFPCFTFDSRHGH